MAAGSRSIKYKAPSFADILDCVPHLIWSATPERGLDYVSGQWAEYYGGDTQSLIEDGWLAFVHPDDLLTASSRWAEASSKAQPYTSEFRLRIPDGSYIWVISRANPEKDASGSIVRWIGTCTDVTDQINARDALRECERLYRGVLEASADCIKILDLDGRLELMNSPGLCAMELESFDAIRGTGWPSLWPEVMRSTVGAAVLAAAHGEIARFNGFCPTAKGTAKWWDVVVTPMRDERGEASKLLVISRDMTVERKKSEELEWTSEHDALTSLPNRRAFQNRLHAASLRAMSSDSKVGLLLIDLDHFKTVNDSLGHPVGDALLKEFGTRLQSCIRSSDFVARIGGDEFAIVMEGVSGSGDLITIGDSISQRLKLPINIQGRVLSGGASIGGAVFPHDANTANELFKLADTALYSLKASGRGGTKLFESYMREEAQRVASQLSLARVALSEESVRPFYQAKMNLQSGRFEGLEALLRWEHPHKGIQLPETIEEAFKDYELGSKIGDLMQHKVFSDIRTWTRQGLRFGRVSVIASPVEFLRDDFAERLLERLLRHEVAPSMLEIEVTEHVLMERGSEYVARALTVLKAQGVRIALDDFGTGHSSLSHLRDYPVDIVKIDRSFVSQLGSNPEIEAIVSAVIHLCTSLGLQSVAEGVETVEQAELLKSQGCHLGQGFLFGRPWEADVIAKTFGKAKSGLVVPFPTAALHAQSKTSSPRTCDVQRNRR